MLSAAMSAGGRDRRRGGAPSPRVSNGPLPRSPQAPPKRLLFAAQICTGYEVQVQVGNGTLYEGVFSAVRREGDDVGVMLKMARVLRDGEAPDKVHQGYIPELYICAAELVQVIAKNVRMGPADVGGASPGDDAGGFGTDSAISRGRWGGGQRTLQRWEPAPGEESLEELESSTTYEPGWNQFELNEAKFGVHSTWDENLYTTRLDASNSKISRGEAERIAAEIMAGDTTNRHRAEERGHAIDDSGVTEEDRYSSVVREAPQQTYSHPQQRFQQQQQPQQPQLPQLQSPQQPQQQQPLGSGGGQPASQDVRLSPTAAAAAATAALVDGHSAAPSPAKPPAWGNAGAGVAVLRGTNSWTRPGAVKTASQPIPVVDTRREHNKVRQQLTGGSVPGSKDRSSPYGTPKALRSPMASPLISDPKAMAALDLNPGTTRVDPETRKSFEVFKQQEAEAKAKLEREQRRQQLRAFSGGGPGSDVAASPSSTSDVSDATKARDVTAATTPSAGAAAAAASAAVAAATPPEATAEPAQEGTPQSEAAEKKSALNPFAKSFSFNPMAKEFTPSGVGDTAASSPESTPGLPSVNSKPRGGSGGGGLPSAGSGSLRPSSAASSQGGVGALTPQQQQGTPPGRATANGMPPRPNHQRSVSGSSSQLGGYGSSTLQSAGSGSIGGGGHRPPLQPQHSPHRDGRLLPPGHSGAAPMHGVAMQGGMPMAMPQTMYMQGQQAMYMPAPAYGMPPGSPSQMMVYARPPYTMMAAHPMMQGPPQYPVLYGGGPGSPGGPRPQMHPMLMPVHYMPPGTVQLHPGHPAAMAAGGPGPSIRSNSLSMSESGAPGSDASFGR